MSESVDYSYIRGVREILKDPRVDMFMGLVRSVAMQSSVFGTRADFVRRRHFESPEAEIAAGFRYTTTGISIPTPDIYTALDIRLHESYQLPNPDVNDAISLLHRRVSAARVPSGGTKQNRSGAAKELRTRPNPLREKIAALEPQTDGKKQLKVMGEEVILNEEATARLGRLVYSLRLREDAVTEALRQMTEVLNKEVLRTRAGKRLASLALSVPHNANKVDIMDVPAKLNGRHEKFLREINAIASEPLPGDEEPLLPLPLPLKPLPVRWGLKTS